MDQRAARKGGEKSVWGYALEVESLRYTGRLDITERENRYQMLNLSSESGGRTIYYEQEDWWMRKK